MSKKHPVIAITGSSGAGTSTVKSAFNHIFRNVGASPVIIEGDSFHRYDRDEMKRVMEKKERIGNKYFSHFGPEANLFDELEKTFKEYGEKAAVESVIIYTQMKKPNLLDKRPENLPHGKVLQKTPTCFFMRAFMGVLWMATLMLQNTLTC